MCGDDQIYAHKALLRLWSPFFERAFSSQFPVAKSPIFVIDPDDDGDFEPFLNVLKHVYGMRFDGDPNNKPFEGMKHTDILEYCTKVYMMADKYDFPCVRIEVIEVINWHFEVIGPAGSVYRILRSMIPDLPEHIAHICGPDAPLLADLSLRNFLFNWLVRNFGSASEDPGFEVELQDGSLLDAELTTKLLFKLGARLRDGCFKPEIAWRRH
jgi:hypothetical protein